MADQKRLTIRQKLLIYAFIIALSMSAVSCSSERSDPLAYRYLPLSAEISGNICSSVGVRTEFSATLELFEYPGEGARGFCLSFHSPASLSGLSVHRDTNGSITLSMQGLELSLENGDTVSGFIKIAEMLDPDGETVKISSIPGNSVGLDLFSHLTLVETASGRIYLDPHTSYPVRAEFSDGETDITFDAVTCRT